MDLVEKKIGTEGELGLVMQDGKLRLELAGDFAGAKEIAGDVGGTCGACHRPYRASNE